MPLDAPRGWIGGKYTICWLLWIVGAALYACSLNNLVPHLVGWIGLGIAFLGTAASYCVQAWQEDKRQKLRGNERSGEELLMVARVDDVQKSESVVIIEGIDGAFLRICTLGTLRIRSPEFGTQQLHVTAGTSFSDGQARGMGDLAQGDRVRVAFVPNSNLATSIELIAST
jgi:hypothetical protein